MTALVGGARKEARNKLTLTSHMNFCLFLFPAARMS